MERLFAAMAALIPCRKRKNKVKIQVTQAEAFDGDNINELEFDRDNINLPIQLEEKRMVPISDPGVPDKKRNNDQEKVFLITRRVSSLGLI
ncbi:hypothetical protein DPMN_113851 [Dreissena polymorpha]|uniref:Uncharacterized protein n=1 Tax=Dreissena polymorpha TaxID=45954 RepID=A0A9D4QRE8_DREPO|nr:hypothetical protein DPMN_113851 [Dreissena polymorpha]